MYKVNDTVKLRRETIERLNIGHGDEPKIVNALCQIVMIDTQGYHVNIRDIREDNLTLVGHRDIEPA